MKIKTKTFKTTYFVLLDISIRLLRHCQRICSCRCVVLLNYKRLLCSPKGMFSKSAHFTQGFHKADKTIVCQTTSFFSNYCGRFRTYPIELSFQKQPTDQFSLRPFQKTRFKADSSESFTNDFSLLYFLSVILSLNASHVPGTKIRELLPASHNRSLVRLIIDLSKVKAISWGEPMNDTGILMFVDHF